METEKNFAKKEAVKPSLYDIYIGKIDADFSGQFVEQLDKIEFENPKAIIRLIIDGYGGGLDPALEMTDRLLSMPNQIVTEARSKCYSAEVLLFSCGSIRACHPDSRFMIHSAQLPNFSYSGPLLDIGKSLRPIFETNKRFIYQIADNIGFDRRLLYREAKCDNWFSAKKALDYYHLATEIIPNKHGKMAKTG